MALINVPLSGQTLGNTRVAINTNFSVISTAFEVDHVAYNAPLAQQGKHNKVTMPIQAASPATNASEVALFSRTSTLSAIPEMAFRRDNNGTVIEFTSALAANEGWTRLPSGILLKWGRVSPGVAGLSAYTYPVAATIPVFTNIFTVQLTTAYANATDAPNGFVRLDSLSNVGFSVFGSPRSSSGSLVVNYQYFAVGN